jgi:tRNA isopentenyl-2-thiomethyl-A-37 hydroxylase MiaE
MADVQTISIVVAAIGVLIAAINSIISSRRAEEQRQHTLETQQHALETRQAQLFMQIYNRWNSKEMTTAYEKLRGLGMLVKRGLIDVEMVEDLLSNRVIWYWETHVQPYADNVRERLNDPTMYDSLEHLYSMLKQREQS